MFKIKRSTTDTTTTHRHKDKQQFNPGRFSSALTEQYYPKGFGAGGLGVEQMKLVEWLRKKHGTDEAAIDLADRLDGCKPKRRCLSPACVKCSYVAKTFATKVVRKFLADHPEHDKIVCVSVVPADGMIPKGELSSDQHQRNIRRWKEALGRAGVTWFVGATDWSFNEHTDDRYEPSWLEHFYGFTVTGDPKLLKKKLKEQFPASDGVATRGAGAAAGGAGGRARQHVVGRCLRGQGGCVPQRPWRDRTQCCPVRCSR
jgi:hypothetical protein